MLANWAAIDTWTSLNGGVQNDGLEAVATPDVSTATVATGLLSINVLASLQAWQSNPATNLGWVVLPTGTDGVDFNSSEGVTKPRLIVTYLPPPASVVVNRQVFYNRSTSSVFGNGSGNPSDAIDTSKSALLPGQTTSFANYTNYSRGLNGIVIDLTNQTGTPTAADFQFASWDGIAVAGFTVTSAVPTVTLIPTGGAAGSQRVKIEFDDHAIRNTWLRVTILANFNTGLAAQDVFYFGNAVAEMNSGNTGTPVTLRTNATDTSVVRQNQSTSANSVGIANIYDVNKDGRVNATDTSIVRQNQLPSIMRFFTAPSNLPFAIASTTSELLVSSVPGISIAIALLGDSTSSSEIYTTAAKPSDVRFSESSIFSPSSSKQLSVGKLTSSVKATSKDALKVQTDKWLVCVDHFFSSFNVTVDLNRCGNQS